MPPRKTTGQVNGKTLPALQVGGCKLFMPNQDLDEVLYSAYAKKLEYGTTNKSTWLEAFVDTNLDKLKQNLAKDPTTALSAMREMGKVVRDTQAFYNSKKATDVDFSKYLLQQGLFPWQRQVYNSNSKKKTMLCGRRSGKSYCVSDVALKHCLDEPPVINGIKKPRQAMIMGLTMEKTAALYWDVLKTKIEKAHITTARIDNGAYSIEFPNGNVLMLSGNNSKAEREKLRGKDISFIAIDECQSQQGLYYLINDILKPMIKGTNGEIVLLGTAPLYAGTQWEAAIQSDEYEHFHATMEDNPSIPDHEHALQSVLEENHWDKNNITFRREYLGEIAYDTERLILPSKRYYTEIPKDFKPIKCYIGVDFGWRDYSSFAPILIDANGQAYLTKEWKQNKTASSEIVKQAKLLVDTFHKDYNIPMEDIKVVADSSHQQISQDIYNQGVYNIQNAYKLDENYQWARLGEALALGDLLIEENKPFDAECNQLVWQWNDEKGCVIYKVDDDAYHPDIADSVKYAWNTYITDKNAGQ